MSTHTICLFCSAMMLWCVGCLAPAPERYAPILPGVWIGRFEAVTVYSPDGRKFEAAAIRVEQGPAGFSGSAHSDWRVPFRTWIEGRLGPGFGDGDNPLLVRGKILEPIAPTSLGFVIGRRIQLDGEMTVLPIYFPGTNESTAATRNLSGKRLEFREENVLLFKGRIQALAE